MIRTVINAYEVICVSFRFMEVKKLTISKVKYVLVDIVRDNNTTYFSPKFDCAKVVFILYSCCIVARN